MGVRLRMGKGMELHTFKEGNLWGPMYEHPIACAMCGANGVLLLCPSAPGGGGGGG